MRRGRPDFLARVQPWPHVLGALKKEISQDGGGLGVSEHRSGAPATAVVGRRLLSWAKIAGQCLLDSRAY